MASLVSEQLSARQSISDIHVAGLIVDNMQNRGHLPAWKWLFLSQYKRHTRYLSVLINV